MKTLIILLAVLASIPCATRALHSVETEYNASPERIYKLINELGSDDFDLRALARLELRKIGEAAWPIVKRVPFRDELEFDEDLRDLSYEMATFEPEAALKAKALFEKLQSPDDLAQFNESFDALLTMGPAGVHGLRKHLSGAASVPSVGINIDQTVFILNQTYTAHAALTNDGETPFWVPRGGLTPSLSLDREASFGDNRDLQPSGVAARKMRFTQRVNPTPLREFKPVMPNEAAGDSGSLQCGPNNAQIPGLYSLKASVTLPQTTLQGKLPVSGAAIDLPLNEGLTDEQRTVVQTQRVYVVPDRAHIPEDSLLKMDTQKRPDVKDGRTHLRVVLTTLATDQKVLLEEDLARYAWYLWLNEKGEPVLWGSWYSALVDQKSDIALVSRCLFPGDRSAWELKLPQPVQAGTFSLVLGYDARPVEDEIARFYGPKNPNSKMACTEFNGQVYTQLENITVEGEPENTELAFFP